MRRYLEYKNPDGTFTKGFESYGNGTVTHYREVTKEEYERYLAMDHADLSSMVASSLSDDIHRGYGYYGCKLCKQDGMFFLGYTIGTCD